MDTSKVEALYRYVNVNNVTSRQQAVSLIEQHTGLSAGSPVAWEAAGPGHYAVFTDGHVVYGFVPEANPNIGAYLFDAQNGKVLWGAPAQFRGATAVPFTRRF